MQLHTLDGAILMDVKSIDVTSLKSGEKALMVEGKIMGAMPMKAVIRPEQLRAGLKLANWRVVMGVLRMLLTRARKA